MSIVAGVIPFKAKRGQGETVAHLISAALTHVENEPETTLWLVLRSNTDPDLIFLVDLFSSVKGRDAHMVGEAAKLIFDTVPQYLETSPDIHPADLIAAKGTQCG